ncbi:MAG: hypothetical protein HQK54_05560 [Oligoflexales bacterium]|nr:hypothetical protein [Oligoflexales bacterium]
MAGCLTRVIVIFNLALFTGCRFDRPSDGSKTSAAGTAIEIYGDNPSAVSVQESRDGMERRVSQVIEYYAAKPVGPYPASTGEGDDFIFPVLARIIHGDNVDDVSKTIMEDPNAKVFSKYGTTADYGFCKRMGDYDFYAQDLIRLAELGKGEDGLSADALKKVVMDLLQEKGADHYKYFNLEGDKCFISRENFKDSENHILMTEVSRYLANQQVIELGYSSENRYDNSKNEFDNWMLNYLQGFLSNYFVEYNARPYQGFTVAAFLNLYSYSKNPKVKEAARMMLDVMSALWAAQSNEGRRSVPFRRHQLFNDEQDVMPGDAEIPRFAFLTGKYPYLEETGKIPYGTHHMIRSATAAYRVPDEILDLIFRKNKTYFQKIRHTGVEIYAASKGYLISAGGIFSKAEMYFNNEMHGWAVPTTLMPTEDRSTNRTKWIRFDGDKIMEKRNSTCVAPGFACGLNLIIPEQLKVCEKTESSDGGFRFFDFASCQLGYGFYVAAYSAPCNDTSCKGNDNFGLFEVQPAGELDFKDFRSKVLAGNGKTVFDATKPARYVTSLGVPIDFEFVTSGFENWSIIAINDMPQNRLFSTWKFAEGDILEADGAFIKINNPYLKKSITLDMRNPLNPLRSVE